MPPRFTKFHGFGNDYIVIAAHELTLAEISSSAQISEFARRICNRHYGAGADGIAVVSPSESANFNVRIFNPDGSEASLSGNGTRCAAAFLHYKELWNQTNLTLSTLAGVKLYTLKESSNTGRYVFDSELGQPKFDSGSIPMITDEPMERVVDFPLTVDNVTVLVTALQMGNPNCCIFVDDFNSLDWRRLGPLIENHSSFPQRTNVIFVCIQDRRTIELRIWERGVGETEASGTCSCAAAVASMIHDKTDRVVQVRMPGGEAKIQWRGHGLDGEVVITGSAEVIYDGDWLAGTKNR
jgi:diaminopimelate epimerase